MGMTLPILHHAENQRAACERKAKYHKEAKAREVGQKSLREDKNAPPRLWPYPCANCRKWHLTKQPQGDTLAITRTWLKEGLVR